ncbi:MAG: ABC transporter permease [Anaerolineales bacterium]
MKIIDLVFKDLTQIFRDKRSILFLAAMPIVFTLFMGFVYGLSGDNGAQDTHLLLAWVENGSAADFSRMLFTSIEESDSVKILHMGQEQALASLDNREVDGVLVIPLEFNEQAINLFADSQPAGTLQSQLRLIADPESIEGRSLYQLLCIRVFQLMSTVKIGQMSAGSMGDPGRLIPARQLAWEMWGQDPSREAVHLEKAMTQEHGNWFGDNPFNQASPGILVQFAIMGLVTSAQILVQERKSRTLLRQKTTALKPWEILVGHWLAMFVVVFLQTALLIVFGQLVLNVSYLSDLPSVLMVAISLGLWVSSMGLLIGLLARGDDQVILYSMIAMFVFSALGGAWFPLESAGSIAITLGKILPSAWAMRGFQNILIHGLGISSAWQPSAILIVYTLGFFLLAVWRFSCEQEY